jgi:hypothetical protein
MTEEEWVRLKPFTDRMMKAEEAYYNFGFKGMPTDPRQRVESDIYYEKLKIEYDEAQKDYNRMKREILGNGA